MARVTVAIGADTSDLQAQLAVAQRELQLATRQMTGFASQVVKGGENAESARTALASWSAEVNSARATVSGLQAQIREGGESGGFGLNRMQILEGSHVLKSLFDDMAAGQPPMRSLAMEGGRIAEVFGTVNAATRGWILGIGGAVAAVGGLAAGIAILVGHYEKLKEAAEQARASMAFAGNLGGLTDAGNVVQSFIDKLAKLPGVSVDDAQQVQAAFGSIANYSKGLNDALVGMVDDYAHATQQKIVPAAQQLAKAFSDPTTAGEAFLKTLPNITSAEIAAFDAARQSGNANREQAAILTILTERLSAYRSVSDRAKASQMSFAEGIQQMQLAEAGLDVNTVSTIGKLNDLITATEKTVTSWRAASSVLAQTPMTPKQIGIESAPLVAQMKPASGAIDNLEDKLAGLQARLKALQGPDWSQLTTSDEWEKSVRDTQEAIAKLKQQITDLKAQAAGGTPLQLVDLSNAQKAVQFGEDDLAAAKARAAALRQEADAASDKVRKNGLAMQAAKAELEVRMQELNLEKARNSLTAARSTGSDAKAGLEEAKANQAAVNQIYAAGSQQRIAAQTRVAQAQKALDAENEQNAADAENQSYQNALNGLNERVRLIKEEAAESKISRSQELADLNAVLDQETALERAHYTKLKGIWDEGTSQYRAAVNKLATVDTQMAQKRLQTTAEVNQQIAATYKRTFEQIGNSATQGIMGMLEGQETARQALQKILLQVIQMFIAARIKIVADWAAGEAQQVMATVAGQAQQTAAVQAGVAARTASQGAGAAAGAAANATGILQQLITDAKGVFGGVFAFLAPVMGPAAAGPAAAAAGAVAAYDIGSWELPATQLAMLHQGEMIVPAAQTPWAQSLMANAAGGAGNGGGGNHYHAHIHATINNPSSADEVLSHIQNNAHKVFKTLARSAGSSGVRLRPV